MPIELHVDHAARRLHARVRGSVTDDDFFNYQKGLSARPELMGFDELIDMTEVTEIPTARRDRIRDLAELSVSMDDPKDGPSKIAIVAPQPLAYGLARMYAAFRDLHQESTKVVRVFRTMDEAEAFLKHR